AHLERLLLPADPRPRPGAVHAARRPDDVLRRVPDLVVHAVRGAGHRDAAAGGAVPRGDAADRGGPDGGDGTVTRLTAVPARPPVRLRRPWGVPWMGCPCARRTVLSASSCN